MIMGLKVKIITPNGIYKELETDILNVVSINGQLGILKNHMPLVTMLKISKMTTVENGQRNEYAINGGMLYVGKDVTSIITDAIEAKDEIDLKRAQAAKSRAEAYLRSKNEAIDICRAQAALTRAINRINIKTNK